MIGCDRAGSNWSVMSKIIEEESTNYIHFKKIIITEKDLYNAA